MADLQCIKHVPALPARPREGHKGLFGRVLVVAGSDSMFGAAVLSGTAALRMGSGLVQLALPQALIPFALTITPELISLPLPKSAGLSALVAGAEKADALVIGPGLGTSPTARARLKCLIGLDKPAVLDADALNLLAMGKVWPREMKLHAVLTPHPGEMKRLAGLFGMSAVPADDAGRLQIAATAARTFKQVVLLKGNKTVITDGDRYFVNTTGDSSLSKAGTGDVLSGIIGSLLGQNMNPFEAACLGAWLHGKAGEMAGEKLTRRCVLARDVIDALPKAIKSLT